MVFAVPIRPIRSKADCEAALREIEALWGAPPQSADADRLDVLATLVDSWERRNLALGEPDPIEAIKFRMEQFGLSRRDMEAYIGGRGRLAEVFSGKRGLSLRMIRNLHGSLDIPAEILIRGEVWIAEVPGLGITTTGASRREAAAHARTAARSILSADPKEYVLLRAIQVIRAYATSRVSHKAGSRRGGALHGARGVPAIVSRQ